MNSHHKLLVLAVTLLVGCYNDSELKGDQVLAGTLYIKNIIDGMADSSVLANTKLYIQYPSAGTASYLYATNTGPDGKFLFTNLTDGWKYTIFTSVDTFGATFTIQDTVTAGNQSLNLSLVPLVKAQNGFVILVLDSLKAPVANYNLFVFNSATLAADNDSAGSIFQLQTDLYGYAYRFNLQPGTYYINANGTVGNTLFLGNIPVTVLSNVITKETLTLDSAQNGFNILVTDPLNTPVANCRLFIFSSASLAAANDSIGNIFQLQTDNYGHAAKYNLNAGTYYVNARDTVGTIVLSGKVSVDVPVAGIANQPFPLISSPN